MSGIDSLVALGVDALKGMAASKLTDEAVQRGVPREIAEPKAKAVVDGLGQAIVAGVDLGTDIKSGASPVPVNKAGNPQSTATGTS